MLLDNLLVVFLASKGWLLHYEQNVKQDKSCYIWALNEEKRVKQVCGLFKSA